MQDEWKGAGVYHTCAVKLQCIAQMKYLSRHNRVLRILFFELLKDHQLIEAVLPWYSPTQPKLLYQNDQVVAYWDVLVCADDTEV